MAKVYINGVQFETSENYGISQFFADMLPKSGNCFELETKYGKRTIALQRSGKITSGLILIDTEQGSFVTSSVVNGKLTTKVLSTSEAADDIQSDRQEFIFFVVHDKTGRGVFTQYKGSGGTGLFRALLPKLYKERAVAEKIRLEKEGKIAESDSLKSAKMLVSNLAPNYDFKDALKKMSHFNHFDFAIPHASYSPVGPLNSHVEAERISLRFKLASRNYKKDLYEGIVNFVTSNNVESGAVHGQDSHGEVLDVPIDPDALSFSNLEYDKVAIQENLDADNLHSTAIIKKLRSIVSSNKELFENA